MQGTRQRYPCLKDQRPRPRTEPTIDLRATRSESRTSQQATSQVPEDLDVQTELTELVLLFGILVGFVGLAGAML